MGRTVVVVVEGGGVTLWPHFQIPTWRVWSMQMGQAESRLATEFFLLPIFFDADFPCNNARWPTNTTSMCCGDHDVPYADLFFLPST